MLKKFQEFVKKLNLDNKKIILILLISAAVFFTDYSVVIKLQANIVNGLKPKVLKLKRDLDIFKKEMANISKLKVTQTQAVINKEIITEEQLPLLVEDISNAANKNNVKILQIKSNKEEVAKNTLPVNFSRYNIDIDLVGDYHSLGKFINDLENLGKLIIVEGFKITCNDKECLKENLKLLLKTYVKK